jgi:uncharacterized protein with HEPN domain
MAASASPKLRLLHIRDEIDGASVAIQGVSFEEYSKSYTLRRVAERAIQIISEATKALPSELTAAYPAAPWHAIVAIGNILRHEYQYLDDRRLWEIMTVHLPPLRTVVIEMLRDLGES